MRFCRQEMYILNCLYNAKRITANGVTWEYAAKERHLEILEWLKK